MDIVGNIGKEEGERYCQIGQYPEVLSAHQQALVIAREVRLACLNRTIGAVVRLQAGEIASAAIEILTVFGVAVTYR